MGSSVVLAGWLAAAFFYQVPVQRYSDARRAPVAAVEPAGAKVAAVAASEDWLDSGSR